MSIFVWDIEGALVSWYIVYGLFFGWLKDIRGAEWSYLWNCGGEWWTGWGGFEWIWNPIVGDGPFNCGGWVETGCETVCEGPLFEAL